MQNRIIIWGHDNYNTLGLLRQLSGEGRNLFFLMWGKPAGCASSSRWFGAYKTTVSIEEGYQYLITHFADEAKKPVVFTPSDEIIEFIDQHKSELEKKYIIPGTREQGLLTKIDDKNTMTELAYKLGFLVPESQACRKDTDLRSVQYPCIIKPAHATIGRRNEFKYKICVNEKSLNNALKFVRQDSEFILQHYIPKESVALVYGARTKDGTILLAGTLIKDRFIACGDGSHGLITEQLPIGIEKDKIELFLSEINYYGLFSFEYGVFEGKAFFFEVNLRNDGTSHLFYQAGANIPLAWYYDAIGKDYSGINTTVIKNAWYIDEIFDVANVWNGSISRKLWKSEYAQATIFKYYDKEDPKPWVRIKRGRVKKILQDSIVKKYRIYMVWVMDKLKH